MENVRVVDLECEKYVLNNLSIDGRWYDEVREYLDEECFTTYKHKLYYNAIVNIVNRGDELNVISIGAELRSMSNTLGFNDVIEMTRHEMFTNDLLPMAQRLQELKLRRNLWDIGQKMVQAGTSETNDISRVSQEAMDGIKGMFSTADKSEATLTVAIRSLMDNVYKNISGAQIITGTPTGFTKLDEKGGLQKTDLVIIAGETSMGKTSLALKMAYNAIQSDKKIAMYSMEMTKEQLAARLLSIQSGISSSHIQYSTSLSEIELQEIDKSIGRIKTENMYFDDDSTSNIDKILLSIRKMKMKYDIDGVIVDYLQILNVNMKNSNKEQAMGDVARRLKNIAKELNIWVIALSQLSRNGADPEPTLHRLRDSGQIAEASDLVILIYRPEIYNRSFPSPFKDKETAGMALIDVAKGRNIGIFKFLVGFDAKTTNFYQVDEYQLPKKQVDVYDEDEAPF